MGLIWDLYGGFHQWGYANRYIDANSWMVHLLENPNLR